MEEPHGELVQSDFYFHGRDSSDVMRQVVSECLKQGMKLSGKILVTKFKDAGRCRMTSTHGHQVYEQLVNEEGLWHQFRDDDTRVLVVGMSKQMDDGLPSPEIVTFVGVPDDAPLNESNPVSIVAEGWTLNTPGFESERSRLALSSYKRFVGICDSLQPSYGAILNEDSLACPSSLFRGNGNDCFENFFVSQSAVGADALAEIEAMYSDSFTERTLHGLYVSTWLFSPESVVVDSPARRERSASVAQMLSDCLGHG
jgi:hypothetical protein